MWSWITAVLRLCCRYSIHFTFIMQRCGPSGFLCGWLHLVIFSIPAHLLFARRSPPDSGLECFPSSLSDSSALARWLLPWISAACSTSRQLSIPHMLQDQRSFSEVWDYGGGKIIFFILLLCFWSPYLTHLILHSHATAQYSPYTQVLVFRGARGWRRVEVC